MTRKGVRLPVGIVVTVTTTNHSTGEGRDEYVECHPDEDIKQFADRVAIVIEYANHRAGGPP